MRLKTSPCIARLFGLAMLSALALPANADTLFKQNNLVSDLSGVAAHTDANLVNPWGIDFGPNTPFWISDNGTGVSTVYDSTGKALPLPPKSPLVVTIPPPSGAPSPSAPTGIVYSGNSHFAPDSTGVRPTFLFAAEDGVVSGWAPGTTNAVRRIDNSPSGAIYKGIAFSNSANTSTLYTANFHSGNIDVFDANFVRVQPATGAFTDPNLPQDYAPFNVENIGDKIYVTYAQQDADKEDDVAGPGHGFVDVFNLDGTSMTRLISHTSLNSPWGMAIAPAGFGDFKGDLLVGNFGDGTISAFDPTTGVFLGQLKDKDGKVITIPGLWGLKFGNGGSAGDANTLFFTAGISGPGGNLEDHGLFGSLSVVPEPDSALLLAAGLAAVAMIRLRGRSRS